MSTDSLSNKETDFDLASERLITAIQIHKQFRHYLKNLDRTSNPELTHAHFEAWKSANIMLIAETAHFNNIIKAQ